MTSLASMPVPAFDAIALLYIYHHVDLAYKGVDKHSRRKEKLKRAQAHGYLEDVLHVDSSHAADMVKELYDGVIEEWIGMLPEGWEPAVDYWGAKCAAYKPGWNAPKQGTLFAGDSSGQYAAFDSAAAVQKYLTEKLRELDTLQAQQEAYRAASETDQD